MPEQIKREHTDVNWKVIAGMRDRLIHEYFGVSNKISWETIKNDLPPFEVKVIKITHTQALEAMKNLELHREASSR
jgi:hypothetical protein